MRSFSYSMRLDFFSACVAQFALNSEHVLQSFDQHNNVVFKLYLIFLVVHIGHTICFFELIVSTLLTSLESENYCSYIAQDPSQTFFNNTYLYFPAKNYSVRHFVLKRMKYNPKALNMLSGWSAPLFYQCKLVLVTEHKHANESLQPIIVVDYKCFPCHMNK